MTKSELIDLQDLYHESDIEMLKKLQQCCNEEDKVEVDSLIYLNDVVGIGWGEPSAPMYEEEFQSRESEYYERRDALLDKYAPREFWATGKMPEVKTKRLHLTIQCMAVYESGIDVPADMSLEEAIAYAKQHLKEVPLGSMEYVPDSDELDEENCDFDDYEYDVSIEERLTNATKQCVPEQGIGDTVQRNVIELL